ncbi:MAG: hypothetical protein GC161_16710 [Planctomycetaceae bacterium]|nr:hypothetical protein [Planctomycetaceae bacterium]
MGVFVIGYVWIVATAKFPTSGSTEPFRLISTTQFATLTAVNVAFLIAFAVDGYASKKSPPAMRRAHFTGLLLAAITLALVQLVAVYAHGPIAI